MIFLNTVYPRLLCLIYIKLSKYREMSSSLKVGMPVYWIEEVHDRSLVVDEVGRRRPSRKQVKTGRISVDGAYPKLNLGTIVTPISEEDYKKGYLKPENNSENNSENDSNEYQRWLKKYPVTMGGGKRRVRKTRRSRI